MHSSTLRRSVALSLFIILTACTSENGSQQSSAGSSSSSIAQSSSQASPFSAEIQVTIPHANDVVQSPLVVSGQALGTWYFEASFPVRLLDANGNELASTPAQAQSDWMTTDMVPFTATLTFSTPVTPTGTLILKNDNPSGDPQRDKQISIPVRF